MCSDEAVEDDIHFLCECSSYSEFRYFLFSHAEETDPNFCTKDLIDKFVYLMSNHQKHVITFLTNAVYKRVHSMYIQK